jgi:hypothetical protein
LKNLQPFLKGPLFLLLAVCLLGAGAASLVHNGTVAFFTSTVTDTGNTFSSQNIDLTVAPGCEANVASSNACTTNSNVEVSLSNMVPGDVKVGAVSLTVNGAGAGAVNDWLGVTAPTSSLLDANAVSGTPTTGLGMFVFRCFSAASGATNVTAAQLSSCTTTPMASNHLYVEPVWPSATACTFAASPAVAPDGNKTIDLGGNALNTAAAIQAPVPSAATLTIGGQTCTPNGASPLKSIGTAGNYIPLGGLVAVPGVTDASYNGTPQAYGLSTAANSDQLGVVLYLPTVAGNTLQGQSSNLTMTWVAEQRTGKVQ